jgi:site-specific DNA-cytosine methylase
MSKPAPTVTGYKPELATGLELGAAAMSHRTYKDALHTNKARQLTIAECAALQSFPQWYEFCGNKSDQMKQIGNAVPPLMAAHIAMAIISGMLKRPPPVGLPLPSFKGGEL